MSSDVKLENDRFDTDIKWTFVGRGGKKSMSIQHKEFEGRYSGISTNKTIRTSKTQTSTKNSMCRTAETSMRKEEEKRAKSCSALSFDEQVVALSCDEQAA